MTINQTSSINGFFAILSGLFIVVFSMDPIPAIKYVLIISLFGSCIFSLLTTYKVQGNRIGFMDYWMTAAVSVVYALALVFHVRSLQEFITTSAGFIFLYGLTQIIFAIQALKLKERAYLNIMAIKGIGGLLCLITSALIFGTSILGSEYSLLFIGILQIIIGNSFIDISKYYE
ncbi:hypothetical protein SAMN05421640_2670 [Ekhidna lutea]|uniref:Acid-resistance membrane protein n=1 Tax=Ekhidna lutea TaxID=447679 RepID=A0A239KJ46_EKHLU|nr:hypothetical protein [Ekhidna lutea]SNT17629.1 hypothetical protein SAMN05421640_2670 [Ekhidna lutea]